jgi:hypothetical protein
MGVNIGLVSIAAIGGVVMRFYLQRQNRQAARMEDVDAVLTDDDLRRLQKTAETEGIDIAAARQLQKGFRYMI